MRREHRHVTRRALHGTMMLTTIGMVLLVATIVWGRAPLGPTPRSAPIDQTVVDEPATVSPTPPASPTPTAEPQGRPTSGAAAQAAVVDVSVSAPVDAAAMLGLMRSRSMALVSG
ncbi:hypothetical protein FRIG_14305 [Frigoribacterium faeni]|uniref:hypothetical protein n=1 Tax=Frigoribacterium TaxID=96492 RepID=UPI001FAC5E80|nr:MULTISPECIES: hypothetical protein [Frigoribacterium]MCJ0702289.1 hypothetical protein [Frigoribacterium faeni]MDY0891466.1 hypothetical protein [Frigoribacterium sp. CFBP9030]